MSEVFDVVIIGAGPAGLSAAVYTGRARLNTLVLEKGIPGGQILMTDWVENYPGFPDGVVPFELMENFRKHAVKFGAKIEMDEAKGIRREGVVWVVVGGRAEYRTRSVIIATGSAYHELGLPNEAKLTGRGVSYCATCDGAFFRGQDVAVVGGGDNALTEALFLTKFCRKVVLINRRGQFRAIKILQERVEANEKIDVRRDCVVEEILGEARVEGLVVRHLKEGRTLSLDVAGLFVSVGMKPHSEFVRDLVDLNEWGRIKVGQNMAASQPGLFAAGDVCDACPRQVATAVGTGVAAALAVDEYLS